MKRNIIASLQGITPSEAGKIGRVLVECGITTFELPLEAPTTLKSIEVMAKALGEQAEIGASSVHCAADVAQVAQAGGALVVSSHTNRRVIAASQSHGLSCYPVVRSPADCFTALLHGACGVKVLPSRRVGPDALSTVKSVLPEDVRVYAMRGVGSGCFVPWFKAGFTEFAIGRDIYRPGDTASDVRRKADAILARHDAAQLEMTGSL